VSRSSRIRKTLVALDRGPVARLRAEFDAALIGAARDEARRRRRRRPRAEDGLRRSIRRLLDEERRRALADTRSGGWRRVRGLGSLLDEALGPDEFRDAALRRRLWRARWGLDATSPAARPLAPRARAVACWYLADDHLLFDGRRARSWERWARAAAEAGHGEAANYLGEVCRDRARTQHARADDRRTAVRWFRLGASLRDPTACLNQGYALRYGEGVRPDLVAARTWYRTAIAASRRRTDVDDLDARARAATNLGHMYLYGEGVPANRATAIRWYRRGAASGNAKAAYALSRVYTGDAAAPARPALAARWLRAWERLREAEGEGDGRRPAPRGTSRADDRVERRPSAS
jgi:hypothetical protein